MGAQSAMQPLPPGALNASTAPAAMSVAAAPGATVAPSPVASASSSPAPADARVVAQGGFEVRAIAHVPKARELAALPNGDLLVGTSTTNVTIVPHAEAAGAAGEPATFAAMPEGAANGVAFGDGFVFVATQHHVYRVPYASGAQSGTPAQIATVRGGPVAPHSDGDVHTTSSVAVSGTTLYVGVGSSCNACVETDPTRATVQRMNVDGSAMTTQATRFRNAIALATDPTSGAVWAGGAGQDRLKAGHPYEYLDPVSAHAAPADYGWPDCEENRVAYRAGANCGSVVVPALIFPAYSTIIGAAFYPATQGGTYAFPAAWRGGLYASMHGSWHKTSGVPVVPPHVAFVPFTGDAPARPVSWSDPTTQWSDFFGGFQSADGKRIGRATGVAVGAQGSLFVADDQSGTIFRIRPAASPAPTAAPAKR